MFNSIVVHVVASLRKWPRHPRILNKDFTTTIGNRFAGPLTNVKPGNNDGVFGEEFLNLMST